MINQDAIDAADRWLATITGSFFPGLLILDLIFGRGIFSSPPKSIYEFILLLTYSAAISFIYVYLAQASMIKNLDRPFIDSLSPDKVGLLTVPIIAILPILTIFFYYIVGEIAERTPLAIHFEHARIANTFIAFAITLFISKYCSATYFDWYRNQFLSSQKT